MALSDIRAGLAANIDTLSSLNTYDGYTPDNISTPAAVVVLRDVDYGDAMGHGLTGYRFEVTVYVNDSDPEASQTQLDAFLEPTGAGSIIAAIESDRTLGSSADYLHIPSAGQYARHTFDDGTTAISATLIVEVHRT